MTSSPEMKIKAIAPWFGGKRTLATKIIEELGKHRAYWEPFCGSMAVLLQKPAVRQETVVDLHGDLINLSRVIQDTAAGSLLYRKLRRTLMHEETLRDCMANPSCRGDELNPYSFVSFMGYRESEAAEESAIRNLRRSLDQYPLHFIMHLTHAAEIVGRYHPDEGRRGVWLNFYRAICREHLHTNPETQKQLERRLRDH